MVKLKEFQMGQPVTASQVLVRGCVVSDILPHPLTTAGSRKTHKLQSHHYVLGRVFPTPTFVDRIVALIPACRFLATCNMHLHRLLWLCVLHHVAAYDAIPWCVPVCYLSFPSFADLLLKMGTG